MQSRNVITAELKHDFSVSKLSEVPRHQYFFLFSKSTNGTSFKKVPRYCPHIVSDLSLLRPVSMDVEPGIGDWSHGDWHRLLVTPERVLSNYKI